MNTRASKPLRTAISIVAGIIISAVIIGLVVILVLFIINKAQNTNNLTNNPKIGDVKTVISSVGSISDICVVSEDNDPNGSLNKPNGYTGALFFVSSYAESMESTEFLQYADTCAKGTDAGGSIEVYANKNDAEKRNEYLATFDGEWGVNSGTHTRVDTVIIRISDKMPASKQQELEQKISNALTNN